jgi:cell fate regulator YaaT (PSP1 superfamily)
MAKNQGLSLNPTKISGLCGRLMCCLQYENAHYVQTAKKMPKMSSDVVTPDGKGTVTGINMLKETVRVRRPVRDAFEEKEYTLDQIKAKETVADELAKDKTPDTDVLQEK